MGLPKRPGDPLRGLANYFEQPHHGKTQHVIGVEVMRDRPWTKVIACRAASRIWWTRIASLTGIPDLSLRHYFVTEVPAQVLRGTKVHLAPPEES